MTALQLLAATSAVGVVLLAEGDRLSYDGPAEVLTDAVLAQFAEHKSELLALLTLDPAPWWVRLAIAGVDPGRPAHEIDWSARVWPEEQEAA